MSKKILIIIITATIIGIGAAALLALKEDLLVTQAKEEVRQAEAVLVSFQNTVNAIPALEFSQDVKNDFKMEAAYFAFMGHVEPRDDGPSATTMAYATKFLTAVNARGSAKLSFDFDQDFGEFLKTAALIPSVTNEDLNMLEKAADTFDEAVKQAKADVPELVSLTVERNKKTEKYFLEFDRIAQKLKATAAALDNYSSDIFRAQIKKLKSANEVFGDLTRYTLLLYQDKGWLYGFNVAKTFPEVVDEEMAVKKCSGWDLLNAPADCKPVAYMPGGYQQMLQRLESIYSELTED